MLQQQLQQVTVLFVVRVAAVLFLIVLPSRASGQEKLFCFINQIFSCQAPSVRRRIGLLS